MQFMTVRMPISRRTGAAKRMAGCAVWAKKGAMPICSRISPHTAIGRSIRTPSASRTSKLPVRRLAARLPCLATGTAAPATTNAAVVEMLNVSSPLPPVPQLSRVRGSLAMIVVARAASARAAATISATVSPLVRSATSSAAIWADVALPSMISPKPASSTFPGTSRPLAAVAIASARLIEQPRRSASGSSRAAACRPP